MNRSAHFSRTARGLRGLLTAALVAALLVTVPLTGKDEPQSPDKETPKEAKTPSEPGAVEVRFTDGGVMKLTLTDERIEIMTPYGKLLVPVADIHRIEFATRLTDGDAKRTETAIANLGNAEFQLREAATTELLKLREKAYPALLQAAKNKEPEVARRVEVLLEKIREAVSEEELEVRPHDVVHTEHSKIAGRISGASLKAVTKQFGEVQMKLGDVRVLRSPQADDPEVKDAPAGPINMLAMQNQVGKTFVYKVTGELGGGPGVRQVIMAPGGGQQIVMAPAGFVWGTDVYSVDSTLAMAVVHAGVLKPGQTGIVKVKILPMTATFQGSTRHGVASQPFMNPMPAYRVSK